MVMEKSAIEIWDELIGIKLSPNTFKNRTVEKQTICNLLKESEKEKEAVRSHLMNEAFSRKNEKELELFIERYQTFIGRLLDNIHKNLKTEGITYEIKKLYEGVSEHLEEVMSFIENYFSKYFNLDQKVPDAYLLASRHEINRQLPEVRKLLKEKEGNQGLIACVLSIIKFFIGHIDGEQVTYRRLIYMKNLLKELYEIKETTTSNLKYSLLDELLIYLNFNDPAFIKNLFNRLTEIFSSLETTDEKIELLRLYHKQTSQMHTRLGVALHPEQSSVKDSILAWLEQELIFWESGNPGGKNKSELTVSIKIHTSLSVPVLSLFTRLFKDAGIVMNPNQAEILRFVSTHFTTQRKTTISYGHLHSKYYQIEESTKRKVYDLLMQMAQLCKKLK
jgi:hypothetical protein